MDKNKTRVKQRVRHWANKGVNGRRSVVTLVTLCSLKDWILVFVYTFGTIVGDCRLVFEGPVLWTEKRPEPDRTATEKDRFVSNQLQLVATGLWLYNNISKNPCENTLKTMILHVFLIFFWHKLLHIIMFCAAYTLYIILPKICIQNPSVLYVISHKNCHF